MRLGVAIEETWDFFREIHADLSAHHKTTLYRRPSIRLPILNARVNRFVFERDFRGFLGRQDVVFFEWASELLAAATHLPKACGIVTRLHRYEMYQWAERVNWQAVDRVILVSQAKLREFTEKFPAHAHKAVVIPEAVSLTRFPEVPRTFSGNIGILSHMKPRKRVYELVLMFHELVRERPDFHLHIGGGRAAGFGDYDDAVRQLVERLGLSSRVTFYGHVVRPEEWYPLIDIFVSNGFSEGLQVSPMEAMATGCYCLSHNWDGADELLPSTNIYETNTELRDLILSYAALPAAGQAAARTRLRGRVVERFNVDVTKSQIRGLIEAVAGERVA